MHARWKLFFFLFFAAGSNQFVIVIYTSVPIFKRIFFKGDPLNEILSHCWVEIWTEVVQFLTDIIL